jgi:hypothetical protein
MLLPADDCAKRRLTERAELTVAAEFLISRGFARDEIGAQLSRFYYVDIDELNEVVADLDLSVNRDSPAGRAPWYRAA